MPFRTDLNFEQQDEAIQNYRHETRQSVINSHWQQESHILYRRVALHMLVHEAQQIYKVTATKDGERISSVPYIFLHVVIDAFLTGDHVERGYKLVLNVIKRCRLFDEKAPFPPGSPLASLKHLEKLTSNQIQTFLYLLKQIVIDSSTAREDAGAECSSAEAAESTTSSSVYGSTTCEEAEAAESTTSSSVHGSATCEEAEAAESTTSSSVHGSTTCEEAEAAESTTSSSVYGSATCEEASDETRSAEAAMQGSPVVSAATTVKTFLKACLKLRDVSQAKLSETTWVSKELTNVILLTLIFVLFLRKVWRSAKFNPRPLLT